MKNDRVSNDDARPPEAKLPRSRRPSPALLVALIALIAALAGSAVALPGRSTVSKNDLQRASVTKKAIRGGAVTTKAIKSGAVTSAKLAGNSVGASQIIDSEPAHVVGAPGEPAFGNGGDGDCVWGPLNQTFFPGFQPVSFYKDPLGIVHLTGIAGGAPGPGGDRVCNDVQDAIVFTLPAGYRPALAELDESGSGVFIVGEQQVISSGTPVAPGSVVSIKDSGVGLDGITFRAAGPAVARAAAERKSAELSMSALRRFLR